MDTWPVDVFPPREMLWRRSVVTINPGQSLSGSSRPIATDGGGKWVCDMTVQIEDIKNHKTARALIEGMDAGAVAIIVPYFVVDDAPRPDGVEPEEVDFDDDESFDDGTGFLSGTILAMASAAALSATSVTIAFTTGGPLMGGEYFGIEHPTMGWRMYEVTRIDGAATIRPPLREDIDDGTVCDFDAPRCVMYLDNAADVLAALTHPRRSSMKLRFIEVDELDD